MSKKSKSKSKNRNNGGRVNRPNNRHSAIKTNIASEENNKGVSKVFSN